MIPPCPLPGHNWGSIEQSVGAPYVASSMVPESVGSRLEIDDGLRIPQLSHQVEDTFKKVSVGARDEKQIRCVPSCYSGLRSFVTGNLQKEDLKLRWGRAERVRGRQEATLLWLQDNLSLMAYEMKGSGSKCCLKLTVGSLTMKKGFQIGVQFKHESITVDVVLSGVHNA